MTVSERRLQPAGQSASSRKARKPGTLSPLCRRRSRERWPCRDRRSRLPEMYQAQRAARPSCRRGRRPVADRDQRGYRVGARVFLIFCALASGLKAQRERRPGHGPKTWHRSVAKTTASPSFSAASTKACVWYPVVVHKSMRRCLVWCQSWWARFACNDKVSPTTARTGRPTPERPGSYPEVGLRNVRGLNVVRFSKARRISSPGWAGRRRFRHPHLWGPEKRMLGRTTVRYQHWSVEFQLEEHPLPVVEMPNSV